MADDPLALIAATLERLVTLAAIAGERLGIQQQQLDRQDRTMAGISLTLVRLEATLDRQVDVLDRLQQTLAQMLPQRENGRDTSSPPAPGRGALGGTDAGRFASPLACGRALVPLAGVRLRRHDVAAVLRRDGRETGVWDRLARFKIGRASCRERV